MEDVICADIHQDGALVVRVPAGWIAAHTHSSKLPKRTNPKTKKEKEELG
jgi:hypothetical protein